MNVGGFTSPPFATFNMKALVVASAALMLLAACAPDGTTASKALPLALVLTSNTPNATTLTTATVQGTVYGDSGVSISARGIAYNTSPEPTIANQTAVGGAGTGTFTSTLTGLTPNTLYYARAFATNSAGTAYGNQVKVFTAVTDVDGNVYNTVTIGTQIWMTDDLKVTRYMNGEPLPNVTNDAQWIVSPTGAYSNYNNDAGTVATYGRLYNFLAATDARRIAPAGWHVPTDAEWTTLFNSLGGFAAAGGKLKEAGTAHWLAPNAGATNSSGFTALPGGSRTVIGTFNGVGIGGCWRSLVTAAGAHQPCLYYLNADLGYSDTDKDTRVGGHIRCIKD